MDDYKQYTPYSGSRSAGNYYRDSAFPKMASPHDEYMIELDPALSQQPPLPNAHLPHPWEQEFFRGNVTYAPNHIQEAHVPQFGFMERAAPYPQPYDSPQSQSQSTSSDMRSPMMETEASFAHSPQDPTLSPMQYDNHHMLHFSGEHPMAGVGPDTVSLSLVSPQMEHLSPEIEQQEQLDFTATFDMIQRTESYSSMESGHELDGPDCLRSLGGLPSQALANNRLSPEDMPVQQEISVAQSPYPEPSRAESYSDVMDEDSMSLRDDDTEYNPAPKSRATHGHRGSTSGKSKRPNDPSRSLRGGVKKPKRGRSKPRTHTIRPTTPMQAFSCTSCQDEFQDDASLQRHMKTTHARPFTCVFGFAGCLSTFASKNEWKRHVLSQHVLLYYWICTEPTCAESYKETRGAIFNRKDLYTQHVRRMHVPPHFRKALKTRKSVPEWDEQLRRMQEGALRHRCQLPTLLQCPASGCNMEFSGANAWDDRMEHVARHLEKAALGEEPEVKFGGKPDPTLNDWAASPQVSIIRPAAGDDMWELAQPLKTTSQGNNTARNTKGQHSDSEDGDWETE